MILQLCFDVRLCQKCLDQFHHVPDAAAQEGIDFESWSVEEHDPSAVQLKLVGRLDSVGPMPRAIPDPQTRTTSAVYELRLQSLESENRSDRLPSLPWFFQTVPILLH